MKRVLGTVLLLLPPILCGLTGCQFVTEKVTAEHRDFDFIQSVGGIALGEARRLDDDSWFLPVRCDLSGCTAVTRTPVMVNSGLVVKEIHVQIEKGAVLLWIESCVYTETKCTPRTAGVVLDDVGPGKYRVEYLSGDGRRDAIGAVLIDR